MNENAFNKGLSSSRTSLLVSTFLSCLPAFMCKVALCDERGYKIVNLNAFHAMPAP